MIRINLIPVRAVQKRTLGQQQLVLFALALAGGVIANVYWSNDAQNTVNEKKHRVVKLEGDIKQLEKVIGEVNSITQEKKALEDKLRVLDALEKRRSGPVKMLDDLAQLIPAHVWLTSLDDKGGTLNLSGLGMSNDDVAEFMRELKHSTYFKDIILKKVTALDLQGPVSQIMQFEIVCTVSYSS
jgi:type IV pilus assembly protein PilN